MTDRPRLELFVRSLAPTVGREEQERVVRRLRDLDEQARIEGFDLVVCGDCVCPAAETARTEAGQRLLGSYEAFEDWARARSRDLVGFEHREVESTLIGSPEPVTGVVFPRMALAEYRDGSLAFVAPSANGVERTSVADRLERY
jgi:hypothetical protein